MADVRTHYDRLLGPVYTWMAGGIESALRRGADELDALGAAPTVTGALAVDLGAGFGMHAIPLAERGFEVLAIDACAGLLDELRGRAGALPIRTVEDDLLSFEKHLARAPEIVLCMGDTLTHLADEPSVERLVAGVASVLAPGGRFVATLRDYSSPPTGERRFIPVRSDDRRILTCFLEPGATHVIVHDILHERVNGEWTMRVSSYPKLRLAPARLASVLEARGLRVDARTMPSGMIRVTAVRA
ncbi:MAG TPA: class I SAM-dependent methyltransferase [Gammaproteobacteria bacterium]